MFLGMTPLNGPDLDPWYAPLPQSPLMATTFQMASVTGLVVSQGFHLRNSPLVAVVFRVDVHAGALRWCSFRNPSHPVGSCVVVTGVVGKVESGAIAPASWGWDSGLVRVDWPTSNPLHAGGKSVGFALVSAGQVMQQFFTVNGDMPINFEFPSIYGVA